MSGVAFTHIILRASLYVYYYVTQIPIQQVTIQSGNPEAGQFNYKELYNS